MNLGYPATVFTFITLLVSVFIYISNERNGNKNILYARWAFYASVFFIFFMGAHLYWGIFTHQFSWIYVMRYTSTDLSTYYLISTFWAGQEGTFLLWLILGSLYGIWVIRQKDKLENPVMIVLLLIQAVITFILLKQNPFLNVWDVNPERFAPGMAPLDGNGLNPLLQDPWMIIHPPVLFVGYSASGLLFAYAVAGLYKKDFDGWLEKVYGFGVFTSLTLGAGIILGGYWAYTTLGWGGYWGWDPVENSSLIPWITSIAFIHSALIQKKQHGLKKTTFFLAILTFLLVLWGSFLTRSGVLADFSVHSFADEGINIHLISFVLFFTLMGFSLLILRAKEIPSQKLSSIILTRGNMMLYGVLGLLLSALLTLLGTAAPIISGLFSDNPSSIAIEYYNIVNGPIAVLIIITIAISSVLSWKREGGNLQKASLTNGIAAVMITALAWWLGLHDIVSLFTVLFSVFSISVSFQLVIRLMRKGNFDFSGYLTHLGFSLMLIGIITSSVLDVAARAHLPLGDKQIVLGHTMTFRGFEKGEEGKTIAIVDVVPADDGSPYRARMKFFWSKFSRSYMKHPDVHNMWFKDIYISPLEVVQGDDEHQKTSALSLIKHVETPFRGMTLYLHAYQMSGGQMGGQVMIVKAKIDVVRGDQKITITPGIQVNGNERTPLKAEIPGTGISMAIRDINVENKSLTLTVFEEADDGHNHQKKQILVAEVTEKPLINILWLGTILIMIGMFLALYKREPQEVKKVTKGPKKKKK